MRGDVRFDHVGFAYAADGAAVLHDIDLVVPAGTSLALVGETGSGKTTLASLVVAAARPDLAARSASTASTCAT